MRAEYEGPLLLPTPAQVPHHQGHGVGEEESRERIAIKWQFRCG